MQKEPIKMGVNINERDQNKIALMNVSYYDSIYEFMDSTGAGHSEEKPLADWEYMKDNGFIYEITCGTYNGALKTFDPWELTDVNILDTIHNNIMDDDFYNFVASYMCDDPEEAEEMKGWTDAYYIREFTEFYEVFIIDGRVYVNQD